MTNLRQLSLLFFLPLLPGFSIHAHAANLLTTQAPVGYGNIVVADCDSGVPDNGSIQSGIDACVANASNHGKLVSCVTRYTRELERNGAITKDDRKAIKRCAAHSDIGKGNHPSEANKK